MGSIDQIKHSRTTARVLLAASALGIAGLVGLSAASADNINHTGPHSVNVIANVQYKSVTKTNVNDVTTYSTNDQSGTTGDANVKDNTKGGNATSGGVTNTNTSTNVVVVVNK